MRILFFNYCVKVLYIKPGLYTLFYLYLSLYIFINGSVTLFIYIINSFPVINETKMNETNVETGLLFIERIVEELTFH